jgi:hypothetical protein
MEDVLVTLGSTVQNLFVAFLHSGLFLFIKILLVIYSTVLIVDVILLIHLGDVRKQLRSMRMGTSAKKTSKKNDMREWSAIIDRLRSDDAKQYLVAILEADHFVYKSLDVQGYGGSTFSERLAHIPQGSLSSLDAVRDVHALSNKIVQKENVQITREQAKNALDVYEYFLQSIDVL